MLRLFTQTSFVALLFLSTTVSASEWESREEGAEDRTTESISEVLQNDERFSIFAELWKRGGMHEAFNEQESYTVFAPSNAAFERMPEETLASLTEHSRARLLNLLRYHVLPEPLTREDVTGDEVQREALNGQTLRILASFEMIEVNDADVHYSNILTRNGIIHGIDAILIPAN